MGLKPALTAAIIGVLLTAAPAQARELKTPRPPLNNADYFAFADRATRAFERRWSNDKQYYTTGARSIDVIANAAMLTVFATAAEEGHVGHSRNDPRARTLVRRLTASPPYYTKDRPPAYDKMFHSPGWTSNIEGPYVDMDKSIDPKVAEALYLAYEARDVIGLDEADLDLIREEIHAVANTRFFRYPLVRLNQINWHAEIYAYDYLVNGDPELLRQDYRQHVHAFTQGFKRPQIQGGATNVGPSYRFIYQSNTDAGYSRNLDSAEYGTMTLHFTYFHAMAREAGMAPLDGEDLRLLRAWTQRNFYGYWTHAGFLNWDSGWSYERWMKGKAWAYGMQGLLAIATAREFNLREKESQWAKYLFDRGLQLYERFGYQRPGRPWLPSAQLFHIGEQGGPSSTMFWARMAANSARAISSGLGDDPAVEPPMFYAYDADIGRLAVSTRHYSTAILAVNRGKVPYGGIDLARFYDGDGDPVGGTGGRAPTAFGVRVRRARGGKLLETQTGLHDDPSRPPLTLTRSPNGRVAHQKVLATRPDAGPFERLSVSGRRTEGGVSVTSAYDFENRSIDGAWTIRRTRGGGRARAELRFPSWGNRVRIEAALKSGRTIQLRRGTRLGIDRVEYFRIRGDRGQYRITVRTRHAARTRIHGGSHQAANPLAGPTLGIELAPFSHGTQRVSATLSPTGAGGTVREPPVPFARG